MYRITVATCRATLKRPIHGPRCYHRSLPPLSAHLQSNFINHHHSSDLGTRSNRAPDSGPKPEQRDKLRLSDQDWEIITGRAIYVLQQTLPEFFLVGLVTSMDKVTGTPRSATTSIPVLNANPLDYQPYGNEDAEVIYSPKVGLSYRPPVILPAPFPATLHVEGLPLYLASAVFIRHTLNALYTDLSVELKKVVVKTPRSHSSPTTSVEDRQETTKPSLQQTRKSREKSLIVGFCVTGNSRVSGTRGEWQVSSTYTFSPTTGLIEKHFIDSIYPAPHQAVYDSLRMSLGKVFGFGLDDGTRARSNGAACDVGDGHGKGK